MIYTPGEHLEFTIKEWTEEPLTQITEALPPIKVLYDIGANAGGFSRVLLNKFSTLEVYAWEPIEENFNFLIKHLPSARCFQKGIFYGKKTSRAMWRGDGNPGGIFVEYVELGPPIVPREGEVMELEELESFDCEKPDLIKMDVEGAEVNIIEHSSIVKDCPNLIVEWHLPLHPLEFFAKHLPNHQVKVNLADKQFYLSL